MFQLYLAQFLLYAVIFLFFGLPLAATVFFLVSLILYLSAKGRNRRAPGSVDAAVVKKRRNRTIVSGVIAAVLVAAMLVVMWGISNALTYM